MASGGACDADLVTHFGQILGASSILRRNFENANQHEYLVPGGVCDAHVGHSFGPDTSRDWRFVSQMFSYGKRFWALPLWAFPVVLTLVHLREHFWTGFKVETAI